jgi:hypothetical protein
MGYEVLGSGAPGRTLRPDAAPPAEVIALEPQTPEPARSRPAPPLGRRSPSGSSRLGGVVALSLVVGLAAGAVWSAHRSDQAGRAAADARLTVLATGIQTSSYRNGDHGVVTYQVHVLNLGRRPITVVTGAPDGATPLNRTVVVSPTDTRSVAAGAKGLFIAVVALSCEPGASIRPQLSVRGVDGRVHVEPLRDEHLDPRLVGSPEVCG